MIGANMLGFDFFFDRFGCFLTILFGLIGLLSFIYSLVAIKEKGHKLEYYLMLFLIVGSGIGVALSYNLLFIYICWELSTFAIWRTIVFYRREKNIYAGNTAFLINFAAGTLMLVGILMLYLDNGTFNISEIKFYNSVASYLILLGILTKSVTLPLHIWLRPAYNAIPAAVGGCLAGIGENLGVILFLRLFSMGNYISPEFFHITAWLAIISSIVAGGCALRANTFRDILAFSTVSQVAFILLGFAVGGKYGIIGGMLYIIAHALAKSGLFFGVGVIEDATGEHDLKSVSGIFKKSPSLGVSMALLSCSIVGFFPMVGFFPKLGVIISAVGKTPYLGIGAIVSALFTLLYIIRFYHGIFFGEPSAMMKGISYTGLTVVFFLALISLLLGIFIYPPLNYLIAGGF
jgi:formate hydrogenlyase subunit 3/multisubunit Na+/H+ antiporter MnhD subunit